MVIMGPLYDSFVVLGQAFALSRDPGYPVPAPSRRLRCGWLSPVIGIIRPFPCHDQRESLSGEV